MSAFCRRGILEERWKSPRAPEDGKTQVTVTMTADEVKKHIDKAFKEFSKTRIRAFARARRRVKVIEQNFGGHDAVYAQITSDLDQRRGPAGH